MSAFIGSVKGPHHNSVHNAGDVWVSKHGVEVRIFDPNVQSLGHMRSFDPIAARNFAALLKANASA